MTPLSGNIADLAVLFALTEPDDREAMMHLDDGGYPLGLKKFNRQFLRIPVVPSTFDVDLDAALTVFRDAELLIMGSSFILSSSCERDLSGLQHRLRQISCPGPYRLRRVPGLYKKVPSLLSAAHTRPLLAPQGGIVLTDSDEIAERFHQVSASWTILI